MLPISISKLKVTNIGPDWSGPLVPVAIRWKNGCCLLKRIYKDEKEAMVILPDIYTPNYWSSTEKQWKSILLHVRPICPGHIRVVKNRLLCSSDLVLFFYIHEMAFWPVILRQNWNKCHFSSLRWFNMSFSLFIISHWSISRKLQKIRLWSKRTFF